MKDYNETTVSGVSNFPVRDITHKPKRQQGDTIRAKQLAENGVENSVENVENSPLKIITLERAISYYKRKSNDPENGKLYGATAQWLEELLVTRSVKTKAVLKENSDADTENK